MDFFLTVRKIEKITQYAVLTDFPYAKKEKKIVIRIVLYEECTCAYLGILNFRE